MILRHFSRVVFSQFPQKILIQTKMSSAKEFPKTLEGFGYGFNAEGKLRQIDKETGKVGDKPFNFQISSSQTENQRHYEAIGDVITEEVYKLLEEKGLHRLYVPSDVPQDEASFIFCTTNKLENPKKLMILIHGSGVVRAGQWARSLIINDSLKAGTQLPYIERARELGYEVLVLNTNLNTYKKDGKIKEIKGSETPTDHAKTVWKQFVAPANPEAISIVAHSYGGVVTVDLANHFDTDFREKVFAVGFTDSVHYHNVPKTLQEYGRNWVTSSEKLDTPLKKRTNDVPCFSAGHTKHEYTSWSCIDALFKFFEERYEQFSAAKGNSAKKQKTDL
ncbi:FAM172 family protein homolog CG10038 isoform X2 [Culicoides brevitarsis]|uniref:FAM172 family protein homolog CG10038 isoform X2 n=1 Tax=Culicoides brevitarsis TaxID=469753 RepID=UPI00307B9686